MKIGMRREAKGIPPMGIRPRLQVAVIGAGFCGLAAAWELARRGMRVIVLEREEEIGGLAGTFRVGGTRLEKFYHHWFASDDEVTRIVAELGVSDRVVYRPTRTGMYYNQDFFRLSSPLDLLRFRPLPFADRVRLGLLVLRARRVRDWRSLEERTASDWLREMGGDSVYRAVWEPLLRGKFGDLAEEVAAVWFWNKIKLRGGSRGRGGAERLAYFAGGFAALADALADAVRAQGGEIRTGTPATGLQVEAGRITGIVASDSVLSVNGAIVTPALPIVADLFAPHASGAWLGGLRSIRYLANLCVVLELDRSLSDFYWLNVNDPDFPFVGVIEHTNFEPATTYSDRHIVYLSRYLPESDAMWRMSDSEATAFTLRHLRRMFPDLTDGHVLAAHVWRARYAQPVVDRGYRQRIPGRRTPVENLYLATMAQIYPQDRGTNYAIREGRDAARELAEAMGVDYYGGPRTNGCPDIA